MDDGLKNALQLLLRTAEQDHGGAGRCARFLLSLWDGGNYKVDLQDLMYIDAEYFSAMLMVYQHLHANNLQLDGLVSQAEINPVLGHVGERSNDRLSRSHIQTEDLAQLDVSDAQREHACKLAILVKTGLEMSVEF